MNTSPALPRTRSCGDAKTVKIVRQPKISREAQQTDPINRPTELPLSVHHQAEDGLVSLQSQRTSQTDGEVGADEDGYVTMRNIQALPSSSAEDCGYEQVAPQDCEYMQVAPQNYEYVQRVVHQQLSLFDDEEFPDDPLFGAYEEITTPHQPTLDEENEYVPMTAQNGGCAASSLSDSEEYEPMQFVSEVVRCPETRIQQCSQTPCKNKRLPPVPPPPYSRRATAPRSAREALLDMRAPLPSPWITSATFTASLSLCITSRDALIDDRAPVPPPRTKRKRKNASTTN